ncbi:sensor histidine kinase [Salinicoccus carnicancri]|uniref:sensor histidine kinase n=1 Tax=Salinicoccus carnicancri TaxID=558170 RepID=UPI0002DE1C83|nr:sensor histidine kinase [Salinicoccus carnicancri]
MILIYIKQKMPWILVFCLLSLSILILGLLDTEIPGISLIYIVVVNLVIFLIFLGVDYYKGRKYRKEFKSLERISDIDTLPPPETPYEKMVDGKMKKFLKNHNELLERESMKTSENLDEMTKWIHDMKMPMTTMKLMIGDLKDSKRQGLEEEWLRLDSMLNEMLYDRRLSNISNDLYIEKVEVEQVITAALRKLRALCMEKGIGFNLDLRQAHMETDLKWFSFIIDQCIMNSVKYSENSDIDIESFMDEEWPVLVIKDRGRGISGQDLPRIFDAGFTSTSDHGDSQATGMGLYLAREAARAMDIRLHVESAYGVGTTVTVTLPKKNRFQHVSTM